MRVKQHVLQKIAREWYTSYRNILKIGDFKEHYKRINPDWFAGTIDNLISDPDGIAEEVLITVHWKDERIEMSCYELKRICAAKILNTKKCEKIIRMIASDDTEMAALGLRQLEYYRSERIKRKYEKKQLQTQLPSLPGTARQTGRGAKKAPVKQRAAGNRHAKVAHS
jgi:hypothetical protein